MVDAARRRLGDAAAVEVGDLNTFEPPQPVAATTVFRAIYYARRPPRRSSLGSRAFTTRKLVFDLNPRQYARRGRRGRAAPPGFDGRRCGPSSSRRRVRCRASLRRLLRGRALRPARPARAPRRFTYLVAAWRSVSRNRRWKPTRAPSAGAASALLASGSTSARHESVDRHLAPATARRASAARLLRCRRRTVARRTPASAGLARPIRGCLSSPIGKLADARRARRRGSDACRAERRA